MRLNFKYLFKSDKTQFQEKELLEKYLPEKLNEISYLEIGCFQPVLYSNSYHLRRNKRSLHVDANPKIAIQWRIFRPMNKFINIAISPDNKEKLEYFYFHRRHAVLNTFDKNLAEHWRKSGYAPKNKNVKALPIDKLMDKFINSICSKIDLVMTDIEGNDFDIIKKIVEYCVNNENPRIVLPTFILCEDKNGEIEEFLVNQLKNYLLLGSKHQSKMFKLNHIE